MNHDESTPQLRAYVRDEYGSDLPWIHSMLRSRVVPWRIRLRRWFRGRGVQPAKATEARAPEPHPSRVPVRIEKPEPCPHLLMEDLGLDGAAEFLRCAACGVVIVVRGDDRWQIGPAADAVTPSAGDFRGEDAALVGLDTR